MEGKDIRAILRKPIEWYYDMWVISKRAFMVCMANEIYTVGDLLRAHHNNVLPKLRNCGKKTIKELEVVLAQLGPNGQTYALQLINKLDKYEDLSEAPKNLIVSAYHKPLFEFSMDCIDLFYATFNDPRSFYSFFCLDQKNLAERFNNLDSWELKHYCYQLLSGIHSSFWIEQLADTFTYELVVIARTILWFCDEQFAEEIEASDENLKVRKRLLLADFAESVDKLSKQSKRIQEWFIPTYQKAVTMFLLTEEQVARLLPQIWLHRAPHGEIFRFLADLNDVLFRYENLNGDEISKTLIATKYPYLTEEQIGFVIDFFNQYEHFPMFYLLREYLAKSDKRLDKVFAMATGICGGNPMNMAEIGEKIECTRERVRQLMEKASKDLFEDMNWSYYQFDSTLVIAEVDDLYLNVVDQEKVNISFESFAQVCIEGFPVKAIKENDMRFLVNRRLSGQIINRICGEVNKQNKRIRSGIDSIRLEDLLKDIPDDKKDDYRHALPVIITKAYRLVVDENGNIVLPPNGVDIVYELCEILREKDRPMSLRELYAALIQRCPEVGHKSFEHVRAKVLQSEALKPIGKSSMYTLAEWTHVYRGSIRDLVADILKKSRAPLHIDEIMKKVLPAYPYTNKSSVTSSLGSDKERFVLLGDGYYGLRKKKYRGGHVQERKGKMGN